MHSNDVRGEALYQNWEIHGFLVRSSYDHTASLLHSIQQMMKLIFFVIMYNQCLLN